MTKLETLINQLCPNGVEYKKLSDVAEIRSGWGFPNIEQGLKSGELPFYKVRDMNHEKNQVTMTIADNYISDKTSRRLKCNPAPEGTIIFPKIGAAISTNKKRILGQKACYDNNVMGLIANESILSKYLFFIMESVPLISFADYSGAMPSIRKSTMEQFSIPLPPLEIQEEIVLILDNFTELTAELTTELTARKKQYEYYRNKILCGINAHEQELGDICTFIRGPFGGSLKKECFVNDGYAVYEQQHAIYSELSFRYYINSEKFRELKRFEVKPNDLIVSCSGTIGKVMIISENAPKGIINQALLKLTPQENVISKFLKYCFENTIATILNNSARGGAIKNVPSVSELKRIKIKLPSLAEQKRIVSILDRFDKLCNDISEGLPAEIEARRKQYEYYRDKLLSFKEEF